MRPTRKSLVCWFVALLCAAISPRGAVAVFVLKKGASAPVMGHLVRADERAVVVREELPGGKTRDVTIPRGEIDELIETVSPARLAELDPAQPAAYFEYAEELAEKRRDPEARDTARRLLVIAASRGEPALRQSSLLALADLARTDDERRRVRALLYLEGERHDESFLSSSGLRTESSDASARSELLAALRLIRQGQPAAAKGLLEKPTIQDELRCANIGLAPAEVIALTARRALTKDQLAEILRAEIALDFESAPQGSDGQTNWSVAAQTQGLAPVPPLEIASLTEFDPTECVYRQGKWQRP